MIKFKNLSQHTKPHTGDTTTSLHRRQTTSPRDTNNNIYNTNNNIFNINNNIKLA
jgi:hypothetical protein